MSKKKIVFLSVSVALLLSLLGGALFGQATQKNNVYRYLSIFSVVFDLVKNKLVAPEDAMAKSLAKADLKAALKRINIEA